jgi:hypothetical protein
MYLERNDHFKTRLNKKGPQGILLSALNYFMGAQTTIEPLIYCFKIWAFCIQHFDFANQIRFIITDK